MYHARPSCMMFCKHCAKRDACISAVFRACFEPACGTSLAYTETGASTEQGEMPASKGCAELTETAPCCRYNGGGGDDGYDNNRGGYNNNGYNNNGYNNNGYNNNGYGR